MPSILVLLAFLYGQGKFPGIPGQIRFFLRKYQHKRIIFCITRKTSLDSAINYGIRTVEKIKIRDYLFKTFAEQIVLQDYHSAMRYNSIWQININIK